MAKKKVRGKMFGKKKVKPIFEVGDEVEILNCSCSHKHKKPKPNYWCVGTVGKIVDGKTLSRGEIAVLKGDGWCEHKKSELTKIGGSMNKYEELKGRIGALSNGWDKEADDVLKEMNLSSDYRLSIPTWEPVGDLIILKSNNIHKNFSYDSQCEKMEAFKKALMWLLDHSDIKKDEKAEQLSALEVKLDEIKEEIRRLK